MKTSWALFAVWFAHGESIQATDSQTDKGLHAKEVAIGHSSKDPDQSNIPVPECSQHLT